MRIVLLVALVGAVLPRIDGGYPAPRPTPTLVVDGGYPAPPPKPAVQVPERA